MDREAWQAAWGHKESDLTEQLNSNNMGTELGCPCTTHSKFNEVQTCLPKLPLCKKCFTWEIRISVATFITLKGEFAFICITYPQVEAR